MISVIPVKNQQVNKINIDEFKTYFSLLCQNCSNKTIYCNRCSKVMDNLLGGIYFKCFYCKLLTRIINREIVKTDVNYIDYEFQKLFANERQSNSQYRKISNNLPSYYYINDKDEMKCENNFQTPKNLKTDRSYLFSDDIKNISCKIILYSFS